MRGSIRSSKSRFDDYRARRRVAAENERVAERTETVDKIKAKPRKRSFLTLFREFVALLRGRFGLLALCLTTLTVATLLGLAIPYSSKITIDYILTDSPGPTGLPAWLPVDTSALAEDRTARTTLLILLAAAMVLMSTAAAFIGLWGRWHCTRLTKRLQVMIRRRAFNHAINLPLNRVSDLKSGGVASVLREDAGNAAELLFSMIYNPWRAIIQLVGTLIILALVDYRMLLGALLIFPIVWITHKTWIARIRPVYRDIRRTRATVDAQATESFGGIRVVRGFHRGHAETSRFSRDNHYMARQELLAWWWSRILEVAWSVMIPLASTVVLLYGGWQVLEGNLTIGDLTAFIAYVAFLLGPIEALVATAANIQSQLAGFDRTLDLLEESREFERTRAAADPARETIELNPATVQGRIELHDVWFRYPKSIPMGQASKPGEVDAPESDHHPQSEPGASATGTESNLPYVLESITLEAKPGQTIAFVGASGSGKTTLCNLIARFYDPTRGTVAIDGHDLRDVDLDSYRRLLGIVEQDVFLFDGTIAQNIAYARRTATMDDIVAAATAANAHGFISEIAEGYDAMIGERGVRLSGGQKQRLAIARAVLADPRILILDEATSNLDSESERLIQASLAGLMKGRTSFVIAHRLSTIRHADRIVVLEHGQLIEQGTHEELIEADGRYADLLRIQLEGQPVG